MKRAWLAVCAPLVSATASADATPAVTCVVWIEGPHADEVRAEIVKSVGADASVVDAAAWRDAFVKLGPRETSVAGLEKASTRAAIIERVRRAGETAGAGDVVVVITSRTRGQRFADAWIVPREGDAVTLTHVAYGGASAPLGAAVHEKIVALQPPPPPAPTAPPPPPPTATASPPPPTSTTTGDAPANDAAASRRRPRNVVPRELFEIDLGVEFGGRQFSAGATTSNVRDYWLGAAPLLVASAALYPLADARVPVISDIGLVGGYARAFALSSASSSSPTGSIGTEWQRWYAGGRVRIRTGKDGPVIGVAGTYGSEGFTFEPASDTSGTYPSATYDFVRLGADVRFSLAPFALYAGGGYAFVVDASGSAIPASASAGAVDLGLGASVALGAGFEARLRAAYRRYFFASSTDELWGVTASVAYVF